MEKRRIRFVKPHEVKAKGGRVYAEGQIEILPVGSCEHFVRRGSAVYEEAEEKPKVEKKAEKEKPIK